MENIVSFSGGKDSTAMLHLMLERGENIKAVIWCDMGSWEFPEMAEHADKVERKTGVRITRVHPAHDFDYLAFEREYSRDGVEYRGWGWPNIHRRWCTKEKTTAIDAEGVVLVLPPAINSRPAHVAATSSATVGAAGDGRTQPIGQARVQERHGADVRTALRQRGRATEVGCVMASYYNEIDPFAAAFIQAVMEEI